MMARELIGGTLIVQEPTLFSLPNKEFLQQKDFILQGEIRGDAPIKFFGDGEEYLYLNADTSDYSGHFEILKGTLAPMNADVLANSTVILTKDDCFLRAYCPGKAIVNRIEMSPQAQIELHQTQLTIHELIIGGVPVPDGNYLSQSPELRGVILPSANRIIIGKGKQKPT